MIGVQHLTLTVNMDSLELHFAPTFRYFYRPQTKLRKGNVFTSVCQEFCPQGLGCLPQCMLGYTHPPGQKPPSGKTRPLSRHPPGRHPLWADTPRADNPWGRQPPKQTGTAIDGTHPTGMHTCFSLNDSKAVHILLATVVFKTRGMVKIK